jgi:tetratricopeptide (TPR) repeat protein
MTFSNRLGALLLFFLLVGKINGQSVESLWTKDYTYCFRYANDPTYYKRIFNICDQYIEKDTANYEEKIAFYVVKAIVLSDSLSPDTCIYYLKKTLPYSILTGRGEIITRNYWGIGRAYQKKVEFQKAIVYFLQQDYFAEKYGIKKEQVRANYYLSSCFSEMGNYESAIFHIKKARRIAVEEKDSFSAVRSLFALSNLFLTMQIPDSALPYLTESERLIDTNDIDNLAYYDGIMGRIYMQKSDYAQAKIYQSHAVRLFEKIGDGFGLSQAIENMGHIYLYQGKYDSALFYLKQCEELNEMGFYGTPITLYTKLSVVYKFYHDYEKAFKYTELFLHEDSLLRKHDLRYIKELKDSFQVQKNDLIIQQEKRHLKALYRQESKYMLYIAIIVIGLFILGAFFFYYRYKSKKEKEKSVMTNQLNEVKIKAFQSQMNPHFVFNCLTTIDSYILQNRKEEASSMMQRFSRLIRLVLENSKRDWIPVEEDLKGLGIYVELEQIRASNKFEFEVQSDESLNYLLIPPLIIQPFVENAILHGIRNLSNGIISLKMVKNDDYLFVEVKDNGIGRKKSAGIQLSNAGIKQSSLGISITIERLKMLDQNKRAVYVEYLDNEDPTGTVVKIYIPVKLISKIN